MQITTRSKNSEYSKFWLVMATFYNYVLFKSELCNLYVEFHKHVKISSETDLKRTIRNLQTKFMNT